MFPVLFEIGPLKINSYGLMIAVGFLTGLYFVQRDAVKRGMPPKVFADMAFILLPLGIAGTRLAHIIMYPEFYSWDDPIGWIAIWRGGLVFQGGLPVALAFVYYWFKKHDIPFWKGCDVMFPYLPMAHGFGRVGCFLKGCCYGLPTDVPWAIPARRDPWNLSEPVTGSPAFIEHLSRFSDVTVQSHWSHPIHPTQIYSFAGLLVICGILLVLRRYWNPFTGFTVPAYLILYGSFRFIVEFYRGDHNPVHLFGLSDQQVFSIVFAVFGLGLFAFLRIRARDAASNREE
ncbi:MAG: prolipoprotein diacylglyceryl transferase [Candidatus Hydrogenedentes bacterium]|nr:prolipoprotein diacylglyceryl transferase [Candidatus Hydrogenedentota bacterium]